MKTNNKQNKAKAVIGFCLVLTLTCLRAQDIGYYKLITTPYDTCYATNCDIVEANNQYYLLSNAFHNFPDIFRDTFLQKTPTVSVFDKDLNLLRQFPLDGGGMDFGTNYTGSGTIEGFYINNHFCILGKATNKEGMNVFYFAKYNADFELVQPVSLYDLNALKVVGEEGDTLEMDWTIGDVLLTRNNEFIVYFYNWHNPCRLFRLNTQGELLEEAFYDYDGTWGNLVETDSHYILSMGWYYGFVVLFHKDSLSHQEYIQVQPSWSDMVPAGPATAVGNRIIRSYDIRKNYEECTEFSY